MGRTVSGFGAIVKIHSYSTALERGLPMRTLAEKRGEMLLEELTGSLKVVKYQRWLAQYF